MLFDPAPARGLDAASWRQVFPKASQKPRAGRASCIARPVSSLLNNEPVASRRRRYGPGVEIARALNCAFFSCNFPALARVVFT
jgi:hypothetical protein